MNKEGCQLIYNIKKPLINLTCLSVNHKQKNLYEKTFFFAGKRVIPLVLKSVAIWSNFLCVFPVSFFRDLWWQPSINIYIWQSYSYTSTFCKHEKLLSRYLVKKMDAIIDMHRKLELKFDYVQINCNVMLWLILRQHASSCRKILILLHRVKLHINWTLGKFHSSCKRIWREHCIN